MPATGSAVFAPAFAGVARSHGLVPTSVLGDETERLRLRTGSPRPRYALRSNIERVAAAIRAGGVVAYPTEGVWGLGCDPTNEAAVQRILEIKKRHHSQGLILLAASEAQLAPFIQPFSTDMALRIRKSWPGPFTWIVPAADDCPAWLTGRRRTLAVRVTAHPPARELTLAANTALVSTSANRHGEAPAADVNSLRALFGQTLDAILDAPLGGATGPSEIRDAETGKVLRGATSGKP